MSDEIDMNPDDLIDDELRDVPEQPQEAPRYPACMYCQGGNVPNCQDCRPFDVIGNL